MEEKNYIKLARYIINRKIFFLFFISVFSLGSIIYSLSLPAIYKSNSLLTIADSGASNNNLQSTFPFSGFAGFSLGGAQQNDLNFAIETIRSRDFFANLVSKYDIYHKLVASKSFRNNEIIYDENIFSKQSGWKIDQNGNSLKPSLEQGHTIYLKTIFLVEDVKTSYLKLGVEHHSPIFAKELNSLIVSELNQQARNKKINESNKALEFLNGELAIAQNLQSINSISSLIEQQINEKMFANIRQEYLLETLDQPNIPEKRERPRRSIIVILGTLFGILFTGFILIFDFTFREKIQRFIRSL